MPINNKFTGPYGGKWRWRKLGQVRDAESQNIKGRRLTSTELEQVAAEMGMSVSAARFQPETDSDRDKRAAAYQAAKKLDNAVRPKARTGPNRPRKKPLHWKRKLK